VSGEINTPHGPLTLPAFLPDATRAVIRGLDADDLRACGVQSFVVNAFHLTTHPGVEVIAGLGGVHAVMDWHGPVASDSGGFQVFSLLSDHTIRPRITERGFHYRRPGRSGTEVLTPAKSIRRQWKLGVDLMMCLDHCTHPSAPAEEQRTGVENTIRWAKTCRETFDRLAGQSDRRPMLFAVVQGGGDPSLRRECAERLFAIGFEAYGFGGWPIGDDGRLVDTVATVAEVLPHDRPRWALGIGKPENLVRCARLGYDVFDCAMPTRDARHGRLFVFREDPRTARLDGDDFYERVYPLDRKYVRAAAPVDPTCDCALCANYSRAYLHHLFRIRDALAYRLATIHNLRFYARLVAALGDAPADRDA